MLEDTPLSVCRRSLLSLGEAPIASLDSTDGAAFVCAEMYPTTKKSALCLSRWGFAQRLSGSLAKTVRRESSATGRFAYRFSMPGDLLDGPHALRCRVQGSVGRRLSSDDWERDGLDVLSNEEDVEIEYTFLANEGVWPAWFVHFVIWRFAADICMSVTGDSERTNTCEREARLALEAALGADAATRPNRRFIGGGGLLRARGYAGPLNP